MSAAVAEPLPECVRCDLPVRRDVYRSGMCPSCRRAAGVVDADDTARVALADWQHTVARIRTDERRRAAARAARRTESRNRAR